MESKEERAVQTSRQRASAARKEFQVTTERVGSASKKRRAASAADERREGAVVLADVFVSGGHNRSSGHGAGSPVRDGRREARRPSPHQEGARYMGLV
jgi:hypothetical protein